MSAPKTAQELMSKELITISMNESVLTGYQLMQKHRIRHLPAVDENGAIVGLLSDRDVQRCIRFDRKAGSTPHLDIELNLDPNIKVFEAMTWPAHKVHGDVPVRDVALRMINEKISSMLVECPKTGRRGILTTDDLLRLLVSMLDKDPSGLRLAVTSLIEDLYPSMVG